METVQALAAPSLVVANPRTITGEVAKGVVGRRDVQLLGRGIHRGQRVLRPGFAGVDVVANGVEDDVPGVVRRNAVLDRGTDLPPAVDAVGLIVGCGRLVRAGIPVEVAANVLGKPEGDVAQLALDRGDVARGL